MGDLVVSPYILDANLSLFLVKKVQVPPPAFTAVFVLVVT